MEHHVQNLPESGRRALREMFERCPHEALEFYKEIRVGAAKASRVYHGRRSARSR